jgi:hypothetical protein
MLPGKRMKSRITGREFFGMSRNTMLITGVSSGLGKALAQEALRQNWRVVGTVRKEADRQNFEAFDPEHAIGRILDVTETATVRKVVADIEGAIGPVDVLVNNAGYGLFATIEEAPLEEVRQQFETNVFGQLAVLQAVLPYMRQRRRGHVLNVTSTVPTRADPLAHASPVAGADSVTGYVIDWVSPLTSFKNLARTGFCVPRNLCNIKGQACASFPDASIDEQLGMIASPVGDRSVGNGRTVFFYFRERPLRSSPSFSLRTTVISGGNFHSARPVQPQGSA